MVTDPIEEEKRQKAISAKEFAESSSCHGLSAIIDRPTVLRRALWIAMFLGSFTFMVFQLTNNLMDYTQKPTLVKVSEISEKELPFPAVAICNTNNFMSNQLSANESITYQYIMENQRAWIKIIDSFGLEETFLMFDGLIKEDYRSQHFTTEEDWNEFYYTILPFSLMVNTIMIFSNDNFHDIEILLDGFRTFNPNDGATSSADYLYLEMSILRRLLFTSKISAEHNHIEYLPILANETFMMENINVIVNHSIAILHLCENKAKNVFSIDDLQYKELTRELFTGLKLYFQLEILVISVEYSKFPIDESVSRFNLSEILIKGSWKLSPSTMVSCIFSHEECVPIEWKAELTEIGVCYRYNTDPKNIKKQQRPGNENGLVVFLNLETYLADQILTGTITKQTGLKVVFYDPNEPISALSRGVFVEPGTYTSIELKQTKIDNLPSTNWGICNETANLDLFTNYTFHGCYEECSLETVLQSSGCYVYYHKNMVNAPIEKLCSSNITNFINSSLVLLHSTRCEKCLMGCTETEYTAAVSSTNLRYDYYESAIGHLMVDCMGSNEMNLLGHVDAEVGDTELVNIGQKCITKSNYQSNLVVVDAFYQKLIYRYKEEKKATTVYSLISNLGGAMGLCLGMSLLTIVEFIEFLFDLCVKCKKKDKGKIESSESK